VGQVNVSSSPGAISSVSIVPPDAPVPAEVVAAVADADQVVIGPGSLFTSVLAVVALPALAEALATTRGRKVYVCNLRPQLPETEGYDVAAHVRALRAHGLEVDAVVCDSTHLPRGEVDVAFVDVALAGPGGAAHDPAKLAVALADLVG
jgi:uncharacterized cofD-like protein